MLQVLVGILVVALLVLLIIYLYQRRMTTLVKGLNKRIEDINSRKISDNLKSDRLEGLMGESLNSFTDLRKQYDKEFVPTLKRANKLLKSINSSLHSSNVFSTSGQLNDLKDAVQKLEVQAKQIQNAIDHLNESIEEQNEAIKTLREKYNKFGRCLDTKSFEYGESKAELQTRLVNLEKKFEHFSDVAERGDHEAAQELLNDLQAQTDDYEKLLNEVPTLYRPLYAVFPDQLKELKDGYEKLNDEKYQFTEEDISVKIDDLEKERNTALQKLANLNTSPVKSANKELADTIDHLYDVMQKEIDAKPRVLRNENKIFEHISHAEQQNIQLMTELQRLSNSYTLNNNEIADTRQLDEQLKAIHSQYDKHHQQIDGDKAVFSEVLDWQESVEEQLTDIEEQQTRIHEGVAGLQSDELRAKKALQSFVTDIRTTKRKVESLNLPGIPQDYLDYFFVVSDEITKLSESMNQPQINMEEITKQLLIVQDDLESLHEKTDNVRDNAMLTEEMIQYANRLSEDNGDIDKAIQQSKDQFNKKEYASALETIGTALEKAEPGSFKRIEKEYYANN